MIAMKKQRGEETRDKKYYRQQQHPEQIQSLLCLYSQDSVQKGESRDYSRLKRWWCGTSNTKIVRSISLPVEDNLLQPKVSPRSKGKTDWRLHTM